MYNFFIINLSIIIKKTSSLSSSFFALLLLGFWLLLLFLGKFEVHDFFLSILYFLESFIHHFLSISWLFILFTFQLSHLHTNITFLDALLSLLSLLLSLLFTAFLVESSPCLSPCQLYISYVMLVESVHFSIKEEMYFPILGNKFFAVPWEYSIFTILTSLCLNDHYYLLLFKYNKIDP